MARRLRVCLAIGTGARFEEMIVDDMSVTLGFGHFALTLKFNYLD